MQDLENHTMKIALEALRKGIARWTENGELFTTAIPGLSLFRRDEPTGPISGMYEPSICLVAQGANRVLLGDDTFVYDTRHYCETDWTSSRIPWTCRGSQERSGQLLCDIVELSGAQKSRLVREAAFLLRDGYPGHLIRV